MTRVVQCILLESITGLFCNWYMILSFLKCYQSCCSSKHLGWCTIKLQHIWIIYQLISHQYYFLVVQPPLSSCPCIFLSFFPFLLLISHILPFTVQLHCRAVPVHSLAAALRLCSRVASPSAGVWCRTKHEKNVIDVSAVAVRKSSTPATDTTPEKERERYWKKEERDRKETKEGGGRMFIDQ